MFAVYDDDKLCGLCAVNKPAYFPRRPEPNPRVKFPDVDLWHRLVVISFIPGLTCGHRLSTTTCHSD
ncbi:hypothetical protein T12_15277 [Trichinella patagoniensis]|uniref:Uncharacterized protein n=1 Tax=Trichinella patagoniensis TaxID=990121 RepID=A0A0V0ZZW9_9BILA|nr:hypothetical protein T12_15277 [Trichinella patagoniensis]